MHPYLLAREMVLFRSEINILAISMKEQELSTIDQFVRDAKKKKKNEDKSNFKLNITTNVVTKS